MARAALVALLIFFMAVTPLSALMAPGEFQVRFAPDRSSSAGFRLGQFGFVVRLTDRTGLVKGLAVAPTLRGVYDAVTSYGADGRMLIVDLGGSSCDYLSQLTFERSATGYLIRERRQGFNCFMGTGMSHTVAIHLWAPVDSATVEFVAGERH